MNRKLNWNDLQLVLAISDTGTLVKAAKCLGMSHATASRHLSSLEQKLNVKLFNRGRSGSIPTLAGEELTLAAKHMDSNVSEIERKIVGRDLDLTGVIRITTLDSVLVGILNLLFCRFQYKHPNISIEISLSNQLFSLSKHEADIAIRPTFNPDENLYGRKIGNLTYAVYGQAELVKHSDWPVNFQSMNWLGPDKAMIYPSLEKWMSDRDLDSCCRFRIDSVLGMYSAVLDGLGLAVLPCYLGEPNMNLIRLSDPIPELAIDLWALTHADMKKAARIQTLIKFLAENTHQQIKRACKI